MKTITVQVNYKEEIFSVQVEPGKHDEAYEVIEVWLHEKELSTEFWETFYEDADFDKQINDAVEDHRMEEHGVHPDNDPGFDPTGFKHGVSFL